MSDPHGDAIRNLQSIQRIAESLPDDDPIQDKLMQGTIEMMMELPDASKVLTDAFVSMSKDLQTLAGEMEVLVGALQHADAFCAIVVGRLVDLIDDNSITNFTPAQFESVDLARWVSELTFNGADSDQHEKMEAMIEELRTTFRQVNGSTDRADLADLAKKLREDNE